jgi:hypothetical protein
VGRTRTRTTTVGVPIDDRLSGLAVGVPADGALERLAQVGQLGEVGVAVAVEQQLLRRPVPHLDRRAHSAGGDQDEEGDQIRTAGRDRGRGPGALAPAPQAHRDVTDPVAQLRDRGQGVVGLDGERHVALLTRAAIETQHGHADQGKLTRQVLVQQRRAPRRGRAVQNDHCTARRPVERRVQRGR